MVGFPSDEESFSRWWPCDAQVIGKDILRFHAVYWPAMLWSCGLEAPVKIVSHGFIDMAGEKLSKSRGKVVDPYAVTEYYGVDPLRYYLLREMRFLLDGSFRRETLHSRYNHESRQTTSANLLNRCVAMISRYRDGVLPISGRPRRRGRGPAGRGRGRLGRCGASLRSVGVFGEP